MNVSVGPRSEEPRGDTRVFRPRGIGPRLRVLRGLPGAAGREFGLDTAVTTIGRRADQGIVLNHPSVSRSHARIELGERGAAIVDLGSTNGTLVDGLRLRGARASIRGGERIEIGAVMLEFLTSS